MSRVSVWVENLLNRLAKKKYRAIDRCKANDRLRPTDSQPQPNQDSLSKVGWILVSSILRIAITNNTGVQMATATDKLKAKKNTETAAATPKVSKAAKFNPFGGPAESRKPALQILKENFGIGIAHYDRGADAWDNDRVNEAGKSEPGWVHVPEESLECVISFSVNEGKGTGRQVIPANEFVQYVDTLQGIIDSDYEEPPSADRTEYVPTFEVARESFRLVQPKISVTDTDGKTKSVTDTDAPRDVVSVRCTGGKGAKPMTVAKDEFPAIVEMLREIAESLPDYEEQAWTSYRAQETSADDAEVDDDTDSEVDADEESEEE